MTCLFVVKKLDSFKCNLQTSNSFFDILSGSDNKSEKGKIRRKKKLLILSFLEISKIVQHGSKFKLSSVFSYVGKEGLFIPPCNDIVSNLRLLTMLTKLSKIRKQRSFEMRNREETRDQTMLQCHPAL